MNFDRYSKDIELSDYDPELEEMLDLLEIFYENSRSHEDLEKDGDLANDYEMFLNYIDIVETHLEDREKGSYTDFVNRYSDIF